MKAVLNRKGKEIKAVKIISETGKKLFERKNERMSSTLSKIKKQFMHVSSKKIQKEIQKFRWYRKLPFIFYKILRNQSPEYLFNIIPTSVRPYNTNANNIPQFKVKHNFLKNCFSLL